LKMRDLLGPGAGEFYMDIMDAESTRYFNSYSEYKKAVDDVLVELLYNEDRSE
jgi:hypothetical protein